MIEKFMYIILKNYPLDENLCLFKRDLVSKIRKTSLDLDKDQLASNILELTINDDRKFIEAGIRL